MATSKTIEKKLVKSKSGLRIVAINEYLRSVLLLPEPEWKADGGCLQCSACLMKFDLFRRRHHCRRCGECFCDKCCDDLVPLARMGFVDPVRHCSDCASISLKESDFFTNQLKILLNGAVLHATFSSTTADSDQYVVRISADHRFIQLSSLDGVSKPIDAVPLVMVQSFTPIEPLADLSCVAIVSATDAGQTYTLSLSTAQSSQKTQGTRWLNSLVRALKMVLEGKDKHPAS